MPDNPPTTLISVIIPTYNGLRFLPTCLDALRGQTYPAAQTEIILVDDASTDETQPFVREHYPEVQILALARNAGLAAACNAGTAQACGELLVMLNNDTEVEPGWLAALAATARANPTAGSIASKMLLFDRRDTLHNAGDLMGTDGIPRNRGVWQRDVGQFDAAPAIFSGCGGGVAYRSAAWQQAGGFDARLFMYLEDVDLGWRLQLLGWGAVFAPSARLYHQLSATGGGALSSYYTGRNTIWMIVKDVPGPLLRKYWPRILRAQWRITRDALRAWRGEAARARLRGQIAGLLGLPRVAAWRRVTQATRRVPVAQIDQLLQHGETV